MLPLWIIDITNPSDRQGAFKRLVGQIDHVSIASPIAPKDKEVKTDVSTEPLPVSLSESEEVTESQSTIEQIVAVDDRLTDKQEEPEGKDKDQLTTKEMIEEEERRIALKNAIITGDYWFYTSSLDYFEGVDIENPEEMAQRLYEFQSDVVKLGQQFIHIIRQSNVKPYQTINIMVLGDVTETFTRMVFPSIAAMLQKEKGRIVPHHIHQGIEIIGMLYVPSNINSLVVDTRQAIRRTLTEIQVQNQLTSIRGYDHMILYQDVQNRTECTYPQLDAQQQAEYILQCLVHLYLACDKTHPLLSGTTSADNFYLSMGAASVFYDMRIEDERERLNLENKIIRSFKARGIAEKASQGQGLVTEEEYSPYNFFHSFTPDAIELDDVEPNDPSPWHPIRNFLAKHLKRYYYHSYLRFLPADFYHKIVAQVEEKTRRLLDNIAADSKRKFTDAEKQMPHLIRQKLSVLNANDGGIPCIKDSLREMQNTLSKNRTEIRPYLNRKFWPVIEEQFVSSSLEDPFMEYHDVYLQDLSAKNEGSGCENMKDEAKNKLQKLLSHETTFLSAICRCFLCGLVLAFAMVPVLDSLSPDTIDLGNVRKYSFLWALLFFCIPSIIQFVKYLVYLKKKKRALNVLKAYFLHDAYARVANRIDSEINGFYDRVISLCEAYLKRCDLINKEIVTTEPGNLSDKLEIPVTLFNQPLAGGVFASGEMLPPEKNDDCKVKVNYSPKTVSYLTESDLFMLISQFYNDFDLLFKGVSLTENFQLRQNQDTGEEELKTKAEQEAEIERLWEENKRLFRKELTESVRSVMVPRQDQTIGDKLATYSKNMRRTDVLEPLIDFAASNGEITSSADTEYADVKTNRDKIEELSKMFLPVANTKYQIEKYDAIYQRYIFVTRWRSFNHFSFNRILPTEDFDLKIRSLRVIEDQQEKEEEQKPNVSSIILWAFCPDDNSSEWFHLFTTGQFQKAFDVRKTYREVLNQND